jgi:integrase
MGLLVECPQCKKRNSPKAKVCIGKKDGQPCGFALGKFSGRAWWIEFYLDGKRRRERIGPNKEAAEHRLREVLSARAEGRHIKRTREARVNFNDLARRYHEWSRVENKSYFVNKKHYIDQLTRYFGSKRLADISEWDVQKWKTERAKETGYTEVDRELACLKHMFNMAIDEWRLMSLNPARRVKLFRKTRNRERFLSQEEISRFLACLPDHQRVIINLGLLTGLRRSNLLNLRWSQIDLTHGLIMIQADEAKGNRNLNLPMAPEAVDLLRQLPRHSESEYVFCKADGSPYRDIYSGFRQALKRAGITDCTIHTLRHTFGSQLAMAGVPLPTLKDLMGHRDIKTTMRYAHLAHDHRRASVAKIGKLVTMDTNMDTKADDEKKGLRR